jgi:hypothetical protein
MLAGQEVTSEFKQAVRLIAEVVDKAKSPAHKHIFASVMFRFISDPTCIAKLDQGEKEAQRHLKDLVVDKVVLSLTKLLDVASVRFGINAGSVYMYPLGRIEMAITVPEDSFKSGEHLLACCLQSVLQQQGVDYLVDYHPAMRKCAINRANNLGSNYPEDGTDNYRRYLELCNPTAPRIAAEDIVLKLDAEQQILVPAMEPAKTYVYDGKLSLIKLIAQCKEAINVGAVFKFETPSPDDANLLADRLSLASIGPISQECSFLVAGELADPMSPLVPGPECYDEYKRIFKIMSSWYTEEKCHIDESILQEDHVTLYGRTDAKMTSSPHVEQMLARNRPAVFRQREVPANAYMAADEAVPAPKFEPKAEDQIWRKLADCPPPENEEGLFHLEKGHMDHIVAVLSPGMDGCKGVFNKTAPSVVPFSAGKGYSFVSGNNSKYPDCLRKVVKDLTDDGEFDNKNDCISSFIVKIMRGFDHTIIKKYNQNDRRYLNLGLAFRRDLLYSMALFKLCQQPLAMGVGKGVHIIPAVEGANMKIMANL